MSYGNTDSDITSYAHDNTPYSSSFSLGKVINKLEACTNNLFKWLYETRMKANADKCHLLVTPKSTVSANIICYKRLSITIDTKLSFENHVSSLCKKAS